ncbi:MAG TPA: cytochrome b/b6 domain-containing protein [Syntrophomonadaceae bacterium]|nr:cytochrome b/b6 domain-containing protein [Syntrophomonadaceae bacterium]HQD91447.1 cytochrome b/b6 domain-containing protein [Syntrophomonadaceae bacterium]
MKILRHNRIIRFVHWTTALSIFILIFTGIGQMPVYKRYNVDQVPGLGWSSDFLITVNIHYIAAAVLVFVSMYYLTYLIGTRRLDILPRKGDVKESIQIFASMVGLAKEPENGKYLAEQRLAFAVTATSVLMLIITGVIKVYKNLPGVDVSASLVFWSAQIHNLFTFVLLLSIIIHLLAFLVRDNRPLVPSMFTGQIDKAYVEKRHKLWLAQLQDEGILPLQHKGDETEELVIPNEL